MWDLSLLFLTNYVQNFPAVYAAVVTMRLFILNKYYQGGLVLTLGSFLASVLLIVIDNITLETEKPDLTISNIITTWIIFTVFGLIAVLIVSRINSWKVTIGIAIGFGVLMSLVYAMILPEISEATYLLGSVFASVMALVAMRVAANHKGNLSLLLTSLLINILFTIPYFIAEIPNAGL